MSFKQADRLESDGPVGVRRVSETELLLYTTNGAAEDVTLRVSEYNAARLFALLSIMLGIDLPPRIGKAIKL